MGLCASNTAEPEQQNKPVKAPPTTVEPAAAAPTAAASAPVTQPASARSSNAVAPAATGGGSAEEEREYRAQLKSIFLHLLDRLVQVMEHERESMSQLAALRQGSNSTYLTLFGAQDVETFLRQHFDLAQLAPAVDPTEAPLVREQAFARLVQAATQCQDGPAPSQSLALSRADYTQRVKDVCAAIQVELRASLAVLDANAASFARHAELKKNLDFFIHTFGFTKGDIANDAKLLERNIDEIIAASN